jgi:hypothetical protein
MALGSRIRKKPFPVPDPGVKKAPDPGYGSATLFINDSKRFLEKKFIILKNLMSYYSMVRDVFCVYGARLQVSYIFNSILF